MKYFCAILGLLWCLAAPAAEVIPPAPKQYFNDYANVVSPATADRLNRTLEDFERQTSSQVLVVVYPKMESDSSIEDYAVRVARAWRVGQQAKNNGAVLFVFVQNRKMTMQTGYGLEGALPDALCKRIIDEQITPRFKAGDFDGGLTAGVAAIIAATKGEYKGTGQTANQTAPGIGSLLAHYWPFILILIIILASSSRRRSSGFWGGWMIGSGGFGGGGGGWSGGGGGGWSGGGGFSGGGGSFGGGGASGSW